MKSIKYFILILVNVVLIGFVGLIIHNIEFHGPRSINEVIPELNNMTINNYFNNLVVISPLNETISELNGKSLNEVFKNRNMSMPDLTGKTEISTGVYRLYNANGITVDYNLSNGEYIANGTSITTAGVVIGIPKLQDNVNYSILRIDVSGTKTNRLNIYIRNPVQDILFDAQSYNTFIAGNDNNQILFSDLIIGATFDNFIFKLQIEKGSIATPYQVPTNGPYNDIDVSQFGLSQQQIDYYYQVYTDLKDYDDLLTNKQKMDYWAIFPYVPSDPNISITKEQFDYYYMYYNKFLNGWVYNEPIFIPLLQLLPFLIGAVTIVYMFKNEY